MHDIKKLLISALFLPFLIWVPCNAPRVFSAHRAVAPGASEFDVCVADGSGHPTPAQREVSEGDSAASHSILVQAAARVAFLRGVACCDYRWARLRSGSSVQVSARARSMRGSGMSHMTATST
jgi:hypothetical protein